METLNRFLLQLLAEIRELLAEVGEFGAQGGDLGFELRDVIGAGLDWGG